MRRAEWAHRSTSHFETFENSWAKKVYALDIRRLANSKDGKLASFAPEIGGLFIQAEVKRFGYEELDIAITWAARPATQRAASPQSASN